MTTYFRPTGRNTARSTALTPWANGLLLTTWPGPVAYNFDGASLTSVAISSQGYGFGFSDATADGAGNAWIGGYYGAAFQVPATGSTTSYLYPNSATFSGAAYLNGRPYFAEYRGTVVTVSGTAATRVIGSFTETVSALATDGTKLYATLPGSGRLGIMTFSDPLTVEVSKVAAPMAIPSTLAASVSGVAVAGWDYAVLASGATVLVTAPTGLLAAALQPTSNRILLLGGTDPSWAIIQTVTGTGHPVAAAWTPNSEQLLVSDTTNGLLAVYNVSAGLLVPTPAQSLALPNAGSIGITPDGTQALVCQPANNRIHLYSQTANVWTAGTFVSLSTNPTNLIMLSNTEVVGSYSPPTGTDQLFWMSEVGSVWGIETTSAALGYDVTGLATDFAGTVFACGNVSGPAGQLTAVSKAAILGTTTWSGRADFLFWEQGQIAVGESS